MSTTFKSKFRREMNENREVLLAVVPLVIAFVIVILNLIPPDKVTYFTDIYTVALFFVMALIAVGAPSAAVAMRRRR